MANRDYVEIDLDAGEDFACQLLWADSTGSAMPVRASFAKSATLSVSSGTVTATCTGHAFLVGDYVTISGGVTANNGIFAITSIVAGTSFQYTNASAVNGTVTATFESCRADIKDSANNTIISFKSSNTPATQASITIAGTAGVLQLSAPKSITKTLNPGTYQIDVYATVDGVSSPIANPQVKLVSGLFIVNTRTTIMESL